MDIIYTKKMHRLLKIQSTNLKNFNKLNGPSEYASVPLRREKKTITSWEGGNWKRKMDEQ